MHVTLELADTVTEDSSLVDQLDNQAVSLLFTQAHTVHDFSAQPVSDEEVERAYNMLRWAPTAFNSQPLRLLAVRSGEARGRLAELMSPGNREKTLSAPLTLVAAVDTNFHEHLESLAPAMEGAVDAWAAKPVEARHSVGAPSAWMQTGYLVVALRAVGLHTGPMAGFDAAGVDAEFFANSGWRSLLVINVGHPADSEHAVRPRAGRLTFDQIAATV